MCFIFSFWARAIVLCTSKDVYQEAGLYTSLINLKNGLLLFCVIILLISFCLLPVKYMSRAVAVCLEQKSYFLSCFCSCSLHNIETVRTSQMYSLYMKIDLSMYTCIGRHTYCIYIYTHVHAMFWHQNWMVSCHRYPEDPRELLEGCVPISVHESQQSPSRGR